MKPFLLLVARPDSPIKADEVNSLLRYGALDDEKLVVVDLLQPLTNTPDFTQYSGVFISGSPYNYLTPLAQKSPEQVRVESQLLPLAKTLVDQDIPTLGLCYGLQILALAAGGTLTREFSEDMQPVRVSLTEAGRKDPVTGQLPETFIEYVAHAESVGEQPENMEVLASSTGCPVQLARIKSNIYGTQHHPEIDREGIAIRVKQYVGVYFTEEEHPAVLESVQSVSTEQRLITYFVQHYGV
ncbi:glutamine amidotransferase-related protein [Ancrocorticia populi]|uniref:Glutamine amidotransferase n=1 Tax=Ancrocorticia populi TaxID=2175228 RepID=A0A2V1K565_9ACTO|nr:gamma-glutamyl-gamma-aminobutyrate hydrolase family protein [Ancrocorticia populi]PWF26444.1 glutamine amidotransferase [Ancrocorticia populi]